MAEKILTRSGIYKIVNLANGKCYVGSAVRFSSRKHGHFKRLREGWHHSPILQNAWRKHGEKCFEFVIVEFVDDVSLLILREQYWMDQLLPEYNIAKFAGSNLGTKQTNPETFAKKSAIAKGKPKSEEHKRRIAESVRLAHQLNPRVISLEVRQKISISNKGKKKPPFSEEHRRRLGLAQAGRSTVALTEAARIANTGRKKPIAAIEKQKETRARNKALKLQELQAA